MGTIAARDCAAILELAEHVAAIVSLACAQAVDLRDKAGCHGRTLELHETIRRTIPMVVQDREMRPDIDGLLQLYRAGDLPIGEATLKEIRALGN